MYYGLKDFTVFLGFILSILSTLLCVIYGIMTWNKGELSKEEIEKEIIWEKEEKDLEDDF